MDKNVKNRQLSELRKDIILAELATGKTVAQVCREIGCNPSHVHAWLKVYPGVERIENALMEARQRLEHRLPDLVDKSLDALERALNTPYMTDAKLQAAKTVLTAVIKLSASKNPCGQCDDRTINHQP